MLRSTTWPRLSTLPGPFEWRGGRGEDAVVGVRFVVRGDGDQGRLCEGSAHELETDREAISGEASRYNHGGNIGSSRTAHLERPDPSPRTIRIGEASIGVES